MNYMNIRENLIMGSQPQKPEDIDHLKEEEHMTYILCLQQDSDIEYWGIDFDSILSRCKELGIQHMRAPVRARITSNFPWTIFYLVLNLGLIENSSNKLSPSYTEGTEVGV
jgi:protein tyrosine phosphatase (PTP) superfamily phosphohydrolase (DUF442 family)